MTDINNDLTASNGKLEKSSESKKKIEIDEELNNLADMVIKEMHQANTCKKRKQRNKKSSKKLTRKKTHGKHLTKNTSITKDKYNGNRKRIEESIERTLEKVDPVISEISEHMPSNPMTVKSTSKRSNNAGKKKGANPATQIKRLTNGSIDLESPNSILVHTDLKSIISEATFEKLPLTHQYQLLNLLPELDHEVTQTNQLRLSPSCLSNEFFNSACLEWRSKLSEGEFTPKTKAKVKQQARKMAKLDPWKKENFEMSWGDNLKKGPDKELEPNSMAITDLTESLFTDKVDITDNSIVAKSTASRKKGKDKNTENFDTSGNEKKKKKLAKRKNPVKKVTELKGKGKRKKLDKTKPDSKIDETDKIKEELTVMAKPLPKEEITDNSHTTSDVSLTNDIHIRRTYNIPKTCKCELKGMMVCITCGSYSHLPCTSNTRGQCLNCVGH